MAAMMAVVLALRAVMAKSPRKDEFGKITPSKDPKSLAINEGAGPLSRERTLGKFLKIQLKVSAGFFQRFLGLF